MSGSQAEKVNEFYSSVVAKRTRSKTQEFEDVIFGMMKRRQNDEATPANRGFGAVPIPVPPNTQRKEIQSRGSTSRHNIVRKRYGKRSATMDIEGVEMVDEFEFKRTLNMEHSTSHLDLEKNDIDKIVYDVDDEIRNLAKVSSVDHREFSYSKYACNGTNQERLQKSSSFIRRVSNEEDMVTGGFGIEVIDEAEFRIHRRHSKSKKGQSLEQGFDSNPLAEKGNQDVLKSCRNNFAEIDEVEFTRGKSRSSSRMGSFARQGSFAVNSRKNVDTVEDLSAGSCFGYFTSEYPGSDKSIHIHSPSSTSSSSRH